jgi:hypothetical protein
MTKGHVAAGDHGILHEAEIRMLRELRDLRRKFRRGLKDPAVDDELTLGQKIADLVAWIKAWDPYPFILLNLALSFQAAYAAPIIMMAQNRQQDIDRKAAENDYKINVKAELEIELLHHKLDQLREQEVLDLSKAVKELSELLNRSGICAPPPEAGNN